MRKNFISPKFSPQQQQTMWPPQQPPQEAGTILRPATTATLYGTAASTQQAPQPAHGGYHGTHWQEPVQHPEELSPSAINFNSNLMPLT